MMAMINIIVISVFNLSGPCPLLDAVLPVYVPELLSSSYSL